jgi:hypothetical protein
MTGTKTLYAWTLVLASGAGFSSGWALRPPERVLLSDVDGKMLSYEAAYRMTDADREALREVVRDFYSRMDGLVREFNRQYDAQVRSVEDEMDARVAAILTPDKKR